MVELMLYWQTIYVDKLSEMYAQPTFTGMNLIGCIQEAAGHEDFIFLMVFKVRRI